MPVFCRLHVLVNDSSGVKVVPSGMVTSLRYMELSQPVTPLEVLKVVVKGVTVDRLLIKVTVGNNVGVDTGSDVEVA